MVLQCSEDERQDLVSLYEEDDDMTCFFAPATKKMQGTSGINFCSCCYLCCLIDVNADLDVLIALSCWLMNRLM
ncbi:hypothetical protein EJB05_28110, partial [Eragrostis curvula]